MNEDRETFDTVLHLRVPSSLHRRILTMIEPSSTVSDYVRRLLFAATATVDEPSEPNVSQTVDADCDNV